MTAAARTVGRNGKNGIRWTVDSASLPYRLSECGEIVHRRFLFGEFAIVAHDVPAPRSGQPKRVPLAQIVGVRLVIRGQRAHHGGGVGIDEGERGNRRTCAPGP